MPFAVWQRRKLTNWKKFWWQKNIEEAEYPSTVVLIKEFKSGAEAKSSCNIPENAANRQTDEDDNFPSDEAIKAMMEKKAVILQEVVGRQYGTHYYPNVSGVLRSLNYYPLGDETSEEGIASLALGLGKYIVDGGQTLRVSPFHPTQVLQTSEMEIALRETQTQFYALDMTHVGNDFKVDDGFNILKLKVKEADKDGSLQYIASTYDPYDQMIRDGIYEGGRKIISFCGLLQQGVFPLPELLQMAMTSGRDAMRRPVEIEFACNVNADRTGELYLLQIRPIVDSKQEISEDLSTIDGDSCLLRSDMSLGHGVSEDVRDVVYVKTPDNFTAMNNPTIASHIERINRKFLDDGKEYILIGPGRWGSTLTCSTRRPLWCAPRSPAAPTP